jgi:hypothetical protein
MWGKIGETFKPSSELMDINGDGAAHHEGDQLMARCRVIKKKEYLVYCYPSIL